MPRKFKKNWIERLNSEELKHLVETYLLESKLEEQEALNQRFKRENGDYLCWSCHWIYTKSTIAVKEG
jgi:hypothetical protein